MNCRDFPSKGKYNILKDLGYESIQLNRRHQILTKNVKRVVTPIF